MKIDPGTNFFKNVADASSAATSKDSVNTSRALSNQPVIVSPSRTGPPTTLLPSTQGDFDAARVARIRASISAGSYQVNTAKIADGLLATVRELLSGKPA